MRKNTDRAGLSLSLTAMVRQTEFWERMKR